MSASEPRPQHYLFAHRILPQLIHSEPAKSLALFTGPEADSFLAFLWRRAGERVPPLERTQPHGLARTVHRYDSGIVAVAVTLPEPITAPEAFFVAAVFTPGPRKLLFFRHPPTARYMTLEYGTSVGGAPRTVLCGWDETGSHFNMGDGPPPELSAFLAVAVREEKRGASRREGR